ncbi:MAG: aldehyde dehydrogenase family protein [Propionibacteriaceae bacterium]|nr:aldehyde dehydrogenase family protein [Propionibacteriaceae bacterium]
MAGQEPVGSTDGADASLQETLPSLEQRVHVARTAFASGRTRPLAWRRRQLDALQRLLIERASEIRDALWSDLRKNEVEAQLTEIESVAGEARLALKHLERWTADRKVKTSVAVGPARAMIRREPLGTVLIIGPWNYPINLLFSPLVGALAAGNAVVIKPSEVSSACSRLVAALVPQYFDAEAVQVVEGGVDETTRLLACDFDHIFYTGNGAVGSIVMTAAARTLTPVTLELGGKSPVWIDDSAKLESAARSIAWGKFSNCGQTCVAPDYILTTPDLVEPLAQAVARAVRQMYGSNPHKSRHYGRIINERHAERLAKLMGSGRTFLGGDVDVKDRYVAPTILLDVAPGSPVMDEEIFGPILPILAMEDLEAAIEFINARPKPLALYVFTKNEKTQERILDATSSGGVGINLVLAQLAIPTLPFGGVGASGMGRYHGKYSMLTFSHEKSVLTKLRGPDPLALARPPFGKLTRKLFLRG